MLICIAYYFQRLQSAGFNSSNSENHNCMAVSLTSVDNLKYSMCLNFWQNNRRQNFTITNINNSCYCLTGLFFPEVTPRYATSSRGLPKNLTGLLEQESVQALCSSSHPTSVKKTNGINFALNPTCKFVRMLWQEGSMSGAIATTKKKWV